MQAKDRWWAKYILQWSKQRENISIVNVSWKGKRTVGGGEVSSAMNK
jgi:hypothetical protein